MIIKASRLELGGCAAPEKPNKYLPHLQSKAELLKELSKQGTEAVVLLARHSACDQCSVAEKTFAAAAKKVVESSKMTKLTKVRRHLALRAVDLKRARQLRRLLGVRCAPTPRECRHYLFSRVGGLVPVPIRGRHDQGLLLETFKRLARPQFESASGRLEAGESLTRSRLVLRQDSSEEERQAAHQQRLLLDVAVAKA
eukprot:g11992.t1